MRGGGKEYEEKRGQETDENKMENAGKRAGEEKKEDEPQGSRVTSKKQV